MASDEEAVVRLERWDGPWPDDDPDANFKREVALYALVDPLATLRTLGENLDIPVGALCRYVLGRWATGGSGALLEMGPSMVRRLWEVFERAEAEGTDDARLAAYRQLREMVEWLRMPLVDGSGYEG